MANSQKPNNRYKKMRKAQGRDVTEQAAFTCPLIEKAKALSLFNKLINIVRAMRFRNATNKEIVEALNKAFFWTGEELTEELFVKSLPVYKELAAAYCYGRDESIGMLAAYISDTITQSEKNEKTARLALDYLKEIDSGTVIMAKSAPEQIQLTTTTETLMGIMGALNNINEPDAPDESDLEFKDEQAAESEDDVNDEE